MTKMPPSAGDGLTTAARVLRESHPAVGDTFHTTWHHTPGQARSGAVRVATTRLHGIQNPVTKINPYPPSPLISPSSPSSDATSTIPSSLKLLSMASDPDSPTAEEAVAAAKRAIGRSHPIKKNTGKVTKKVHKAEREKHKRDQLNDLFLELGLALEPIRQNNGKACILSDAARLLRDLAAHVESLRKENASLITESRYVTVEKNELKDEKVVLETEISRLRNELQERVRSTETVSVLHQPINTLAPMPLPSIRPLYVVPVHQDPRPCVEAGSTAASPTPPLVRKPQARYPTPSDSWPLELLLRTSQEARHSGSSTSNASDGSREGSDKV